MRGSPLLRALLAFLTILALGYPLRRLTGEASPPAQAVPESAPAAAAAEQEVELQLTFTSAPARFAIRHLGAVVWSAEGTGTSAEKKLRLPYPAEGVELQFTADFPDGAPLAAARLTLTDPAGESHERSCWGTGRIDEVVAFP